MDALMSLANLGKTAGQGLGSLNGQYGSGDSASVSTSDSWGGSWGQSASNAYLNSDAWSLMKAIQNSGSESSGSSRTFGREASAADIERAAEANQVQRDFWSEQADYNAKQAQLDRDFQERMSNTAYQRAVVDLLKAGLNPILAVGNMGASTPVGAMASSGLATAQKATTFPESYSSSASSSWSRGESGSASKSKTRSKSESSSSQGSSEGSHSESHSNSKYDLSNNLLDLYKKQTGLLDDLFKGGSAQRRSGGGAW